jgi:hypothetical protein
MTITIAGQCRHYVHTHYHKYGESSNDRAGKYGIVLLGGSACCAPEWHLIAPQCT